MEKEKFANFRGFEKVEVYKISVNEGQGIIGDPIYREIYYVTEDGRIVGHESGTPLRKYAGEH